MRTRAYVAWPGPKRQRAGAVQDAGAKGHDYREREASWTAVALHRFSPKMRPLNISQKTKSRYDLWQRSIPPFVKYEAGWIKIPPPRDGPQSNPLARKPGHGSLCQFFNLRVEGVEGKTFRHHAMAGIGEDQPRQRRNG